MSGLCELGKDICQEYDQRKQVLASIHTETEGKLQQYRQELVEQKRIDDSEHHKARIEIRIGVVKLLTEYGQERKAMLEVLNSDRVSQSRELAAWREEKAQDLKGWYEAGQSLLKKRIGR